MRKKTEPPHAVDEWSEKLRGAVRKDRGRFYRGLGLVLLLAGVIGGGLLWWFVPRGGQVPLAMVAFDQVASPGESVPLHAQVEPIEGAPGDLADLTVIFLDDPVMLQPGASLKTVRTATLARGQALASMSFPKETVLGKFLARLPGERRRAPSDDHARVYFLPPQTKLLLVDVQQLLEDPNPEIWSGDLTRIAPNQEAAGALKALEAAKYQLVYLAMDGDRALDYRQQRRWLESKSPQFPPGPVLGRTAYHQGEMENEARDHARRQQLSRLANHSASMTAIAQNRAAAALYRALKVSTVMIGPEDVPADVLRAASWQEVPEVLSEAAK